MSAPGRPPTARAGLDRLRTAWDGLERDRRLAAALVAGAALLLVELRFEHREALGETWAAWLPIAHAAAMVLFGSLAIVRWRAGGRRILATLSAAAVAVGLLGLWFHSGGHPFRAAKQVFAVWLVRPGLDGGVKPGSRPPALAPLAYCGLGALGLLVSGRPARAVRGPAAA